MSVDLQYFIILGLNSTVGAMMITYPRMVHKDSGLHKDLLHKLHTSKVSVRIDDDKTEEWLQLQLGSNQWSRNSVQYVSLMWEADGDHHLVSLPSKILCFQGCPLAVVMSFRARVCAAELGSRTIACEDTAPQPSHYLTEVRQWLSNVNHDFLTPLCVPK